MHSRWITWVLLLGLMVLGTGASMHSVHSVQQARDLQWAGDLAMALEQWEVAYSFYKEMADTFPNTPHGRVAEYRLGILRGKMTNPARPPQMEHPASWLSEVFEVLTWP